MRTTKMIRTAIIGDVHGCIDELIILLDRLSLSKSDQLVFIGDLIDKGPDSAAVVRLAAKLSQQMDVILIVGNHEDKFLRFCDHQGNDSGIISTMKGVENYESLASDLTESDVEFLRSGFLLKFFDGLDLTLVHGGICASIGLAGRESIPYGGRSKKDNHHLLTMTRNVTGNGKFLGLDVETPYMRYWADAYRGEYGKVVFGHQPFNDVKIFPHAVGIDTGCVFGNKLTAMILEDGESHFEQVKAKRAYAEHW